MIPKIDTYEFGVVYKKEKNPILLLNELNHLLGNIFEVKVYYTTSKGYDEQYQHLASKARIKSNDRFIFICFLYVDYLDTHITVVQHSSANYLTFKCYGLFQNDEKSKNKSIFTFDFLKNILDLKYKIRNVKVDLAIDFKEDFYTVIEKFEPVFKAKNREPYLYKENETVYFNTPLVNDCILKQKNSNEDLQCSQKNTYLNIVLYNKSIKNRLNYELTRLEFSFKNVFNTPKMKYLNKFEDIDILVKSLGKRVEKFLNLIGQYFK